MCCDEGSELHVNHPVAPEGVGAELHRAIECLVLEPPAVDLVVPVLVGGDELDPPRDVLVSARREEEPEPGLAQMTLLEVVRHAAQLAVVVGADLDGRLTDFERGLGRRQLALLGDQYARLGSRALQVKRQRQPGKASAEDRDVVLAPRRPDRLDLEL